jgi:hypothetical protein
VVVTLLFVFAGCAAQRPTAGPPEAFTPAPGGAFDKNAERGWWQVYFFINWAEDSEPNWYMDPLLAHRIVAPVLERYRNQVLIWRFHRRAARDDAGHRFTFYFYTTPEVAAQMIKDIRYSELLSRLTAEGQILRTEFGNPMTNPHPGVADVSDGHWTPAMQSAWPYFIMGASQMWLNLIAEVAADRPPLDEGSSLAEIQNFYGEVANAINQLWQKDGRHALLHHLNAIFEYRPIQVYEKRWLKF